jgi:hypothetical protein
MRVDEEDINEQRTNRSETPSHHAAKRMSCLCPGLGL